MIPTLGFIGVLLAMGCGGKAVWNRELWVSPDKPEVAFILAIIAGLFWGWIAGFCQGSWGGIGDVIALLIGFNRLWVAMRPVPPAIP